MIRVAKRLLAAMAIVALLAYNAAAQDKPPQGAGKPGQPPAAAPKGPDKDPKNPTQAADKPANRDTNRDAQKSPERPRDTSRDAQRSPDRSRDTSRDAQRSPDRSRDTQGTTDRNRDTNRDAQRSPDRSRDTSRDTQRGPDQGKEGGKQISASDLGFSFSDESDDKGLKISKISSNTLATKAKFKEGDIIVSINDNRVRSDRDFILFLQRARERIPVIVLRDDREVTVYLEPEVIQEFVVTSSGGWLGVDLYDRFTRAAVVLKVHPNSPAERAGLKSDDLILAVDGTEIHSPEHLGEVIGGLAPGTKVEVEIERNRREQVVDATLGRKENVAQRTEVRQRATILPRR